MTQEELIKQLRILHARFVLMVYGELPWDEPTYQLVEDLAEWWYERQT
jgi:hypothetical protein